MGMRRYMKQGDTKPDFDPVVTHESGPLAGRPVDFSAADSVAVTGYQKSTVIFTDEPATGTAEGSVVMEWPDGSTDAVGEIQCYIRVTWATGEIQTIPGPGHLAVVIEPLPGFTP